MIVKLTLKSIADFVRKIPDTALVIGFKKKYPDTYLFIANRLSLTAFSGLPLTVLSIAIVSNLLLLFDFTEDTINSKEFIALDSFMAEMFFNLRSEPIAKSFYYLSKLCDIPAVSVIGVLLSIYFLVKEKLHFTIGIVTSLLGSGLSVYWVKTYLK